MAKAPPAKDDYMQCPYNESHHILRSRFQVHLIRCREDHKDAKKVTCPYNVTHIVNENELAWHKTVCPDKKSVDLYKYTIDTGVPKRDDIPPVEYMHEVIECSENWGPCNEPSYDPTAYAESAPVLRTRSGLKPSERRAFRDAERKRLRHLQKQ